MSSKIDKEQKKFERLEKQALAEKQKVLKPGECMKYIIVDIDIGCLTTKLMGTEIVSSLAGAKIQYEIKRMVVPNTITFSRNLPQNLKSSNDKELELTEKIITEKYVLLMMSGEDLVNHVKHKMLLDEIKRVKSSYPSYKISLIVCGLKVFCRANRGCVGRTETEFALTETQLLMDCCHRLLENPEEVSTTISQFTKSVAEEPYKKQVADKYEKETFYLGNDSKDCVKVQNGIGLSRLWQQQLIKLPLVTLEIAEAITSVYPMPSLLIEALEKSNTPEELIANFPIRRAGGPLTSVRRIGPELSRRICKIFMSLDPNTSI